MQRVLILGCCGAGKSTFARQLHAATGLEVIHLDQHYWQADWQEPEKAEWTRSVTTLADRPSWIMDGNYGGSLDLRLRRADTVLYLDYPTVTCLWRISKRIFRYHGQVRPDMPPGCRERFDADFYHYVATFNLLRRKGILRKLNRVREEKRVLVFRNDRETQRFIELSSPA